MSTSSGATKLEKTEMGTGIFQLAMFGAIFAMIADLIRGSAEALEATDFKILMWSAGLIDLLRALYKTIHLFVTKNRNLDKYIHFFVEWFKAGLIVTAITPRFVETLAYHGFLGKAALAAVAPVAAATPFLFLAAMAGWALFELGAVAWLGYKYYRYAYSEDYKDHQEHPEVKHLVQRYKASLTMHSTKLAMALGLTISILLVFVLHVAVPYIGAITAFALFAYAAYGVYNWYRLPRVAKEEEAKDLNIQQVSSNQPLEKEAEKPLLAQNVSPLAENLKEEMEGDYFYRKDYSHILSLTEMKEVKEKLFSEIEQYKDKIKYDNLEEGGSFNGILHQLDQATQAFKRADKLLLLTQLNDKVNAIGQQQAGEPVKLSRRAGQSFFKDESRLKALLEAVQSAENRFAPSA